MAKGEQQLLFSYASFTWMKQLEGYVMLLQVNNFIIVVAYNCFILCICVCLSKHDNAIGIDIQTIP